MWDLGVYRNVKTKGPKFFFVATIRKGKERKGIRMSEYITPARGPLFGPNMLPIFYHIFPSTVQVYCMLLVGNQVLWKHQCKSLHFKSTRADVHYTSASFGTTPPTLYNLALSGIRTRDLWFSSRQCYRLSH
jgi:hypothetical protein